MVSEVFDEIQSSLSAISARDLVEIRALQDRISSEIGSFLDHTKDTASGSRTDLVLTVNNFKADALEEAQKAGMAAHQQESKLAVEVGAFKSESENVKLKSVWTYSIVLCLACICFAAQAKSPKPKKVSP